MSVLTISPLKKEYNSHLILQIDHLQFVNGLFWIKGNNGSGKSTLLKIISGMIPFEGEVNIDGIDLRKQSTDYRRLVNYAEAEPLYPPFLTGQDLISFFTSTRKARKEEVDALIQKFNIDSFIKNPIGTYSSGMVKKLSLVLAFIGQPKYILLDEPLVTIDKESVPILYDLVKLYFNKGVNFIFTSHQAFELEGIAVKELEVKDHRVWEL
jgi:ABC-2 type transport system ATP-binding protein